jgi:hypothetical protein
LRRYIASGVSLKPGIRQKIEASVLALSLHGTHMRDVLSVFLLFLVLREDLV